MDNRPIGVFDTGVGGLTAVRELHKILPGEDIVYFGDTGRVPYGSRSRQTIQRYAVQDIKYLLTFGVKAVVAACGTVSSNVTEKELQDIGLEVPYFEVVNPATRAACAASQNGRIGVLATVASIRSGAYGRALRAVRPSAKLFGNAAPLLVPLVENGMFGLDSVIARLVVEQYVEPLRKQDIDTLILGCTHYPMLYGLIDDVLQSRVHLVDAGAAAARELRIALCEKGLLSARKTGQTIYRVTDTVENFTEVAVNFLAERVEDTTQYVDIDMITSL